MKTLRVYGDGEFILIKIWQFCKKQGIVIKYAVFYMYKKNSFAKRKWCTIVIMKDSLLINSGLPSYFWVKIIESANYLKNKLLTKINTSKKIIFKKV